MLDKRVPSNRVFGSVVFRDSIFLYWNEDMWKEKNKEIEEVTNISVLCSLNIFTQILEFPCQRFWV